MSSNNIPLKLLRGYKNNLPTTIEDGMIYYCIDSNELFFDYVNNSTTPPTEHRYCLNPMVGETDYGDPVGKGLVSPEDKEIIDTAVRFVEQQLEPEQQKQARLNINAVGEKTLEGGEIFNGYGNNIAFSYAHTEGQMNAATGENSHAEGFNTTAAGLSAHSEGEGLGYATLSSAATAGSNTFTVNNLNNFEIGKRIVLNDETKKITAIDSSTMTITVDSNFEKYTPEGAFLYLSGAIGDYSHSEGYKTLATGDYSHAEGSNTEATNSGAHAEGRYTVASGTTSHAEGRNTLASGNTSHAEGEDTQATGYGSHAEGGITQASGAMSHAEGEETVASGEISHAEGSGTLAEGYGAHAEGCITQALGYVAHAEGENTVASGKASHAEGCETEANGSMSHAEGYKTKTYGDTAHAEGYETEAYERAHAEGRASIAEGKGSHAEGYYTHAVGEYSHTEGMYTQTLAEYAHAEGNRTKAIGIDSHAEGKNTQTIGKGSHAEGSMGVAFGDYSHVEGQGFDYPINLIGTGPTYEVQDVEFPGEEDWIILDPFVFFNLSAGTILKYIHPTEGIKYCYVSEVDLENEIITLSSTGTYEKIIEDGNYLITSPVEYEYIFYIPDPISETNPTMYITSIANLGAHIEGIETMALGTGSHSEGYRTQATKFASHAEGNKTIASSNGAHAEGEKTEASRPSAHAEGYYTKANGYYSHAEGIWTNASGYASHAEGENTKALKDYSHAEGYQTKANNAIAHAEGSYTEANGYCSHTEGYQTKTQGSWSHAEGYYTIASGENQHVQGKYNIEDTENKYAHIVGNGTSSASSNAHTLDWEGNAWFAGDIYVKGSGQDDTENVHKLSYNSIEQQNTNSPHKNIKFWVGTQEELDTIEDRQDDCLYFTTGEGREEGGGSGSGGGPSIQTISLSVSDWDVNFLSQNVSVTGIIADPLKQIITVSPSSSSREEYLDCGIQCISQGTDSLTFKAESIPNSNLSVYVAIQKANN